MWYRKKNKENLFVVYYVLTIVAFPLMAILASVLDVETIVTMIPYRGTVLILAVFLLVFHKNKIFTGENNLVIYIFIVFVVYYLLRISLYLYLDTQNSFITFKLKKSYYLMLAGGVSFFPSLVFLKKLNLETYNKIIKYFKFLFPLVLLLLYIQGLEYIRDSHTWQTGQIHFSKFSYINFGHFGTSVALFFVFLLFTNKNKSTKIFLFYLIVTLWGIFTTFYSGSRGAMIALIGSLAFFAIARMKKNKAILFLLVLFLALYITIPFISEIFHISALERIDSAISGADKSTSLRLFFYETAWDNFLQNPLFGGALEVRTLGQSFYPHNIIFEGFMSAGLFGGGLLLAILYFSLKKSNEILRIKSYLGWVALLNIQYIIAGFFSGSIYSNFLMWWLIALNIGVPLINLNQIYHKISKMNSANSKI